MTIFHQKFDEIIFSNKMSKTSYSPHGFTLSAQQVKNLSEGKVARLTVDKLQGGHEVHLTKTQLAKVHKCLASGVGMDLKLSASQLRHHKIMGGGIFGDIWGGIKRGANYAWNKVGKPVFQSATAQGQKILEKQIMPRVKTGAHNMANAGVKQLTGYADRGLKSIGMGVTGTAIPAPKKRGRKPKGVNGEGFFDDLGSAFSGAVGGLTKIGIPIATQIIAKRLGGGIYAPSTNGQ